MSRATAFDEHMMTIALRLARRGLGATAPNPAVGAVIADETTGEIIARGWTQPGGRPHAEKEALARAGDRARGKTMYVTLEPCAHTGRTPTCADAMVTSGLARVVCAIPDPNPVVAGRGFGQLRAAGMDVDVGLLEDEARHVTLGHILRQTADRPFVQIKMALDAGGAIAEGDGAPVWVTGPEARALAHMLRAEADAIVVGSGTVMADDPELTCRLPGLAARSPDRVVLDASLRTSPTARVYRSGKPGPRVWLASRTGTTGRHTALPLETGADEGLPSVLAALARNGITRILVEGGPRLWQDFFDAGLVDEVVVMSAPHRIEGASRPILDRDPEAHFSALGFRLADRRAAAADRILTFRREPS